MNRLAREKSLYLKQHASNPVNWYPWSEDAFNRAKTENRLIFLSIGYSSCHWCHVMEKECFEDTEVAELLNKYFVSIKVDREERPDVDDVFMTLCQAMTGHGGWPLSIFLTPDAKPFFSATYIPKSNLHGYPGMMEILPKMAQLWQKKPELIVEEAERIYQTLKTSYQDEPYGERQPDSSLPERLFGILKNSYDPEWGGFGKAPKFPMASNLLFLLEFAKRYPASSTMEMLSNTLTRMALGGIRDHVGGGFHRYSTDRFWRLPHFEKMLYDQALLLEVYSEAYSLTEDELFLELAGEIVEFVKQWFVSEDGTFYTSLDADTEGREGGYYLWSREEIIELLGDETGEKICRLFDIRREGNFRDESTGRLTGKNVIYLNELLEDVRIAKGALKKLKDARLKRTPPAVDRKVLCDINALMISALCRYVKASASWKPLELARHACDFFVRRLKNEITGHCYYDGELYTTGMLSDYASLIKALLELYSLTSEKELIRISESLCVRAIELFYNEKQERFIPYIDDPKLIDIPIEPFDSVIPSEVSLMLEALWRLYTIGDEYRFKKVFDKAVSSISSTMNNSPQMYTYLISFLLRESFF